MRIAAGDVQGTAGDFEALEPGDRADLGVAVNDDLVADAAAVERAGNGRAVDEAVEGAGRSEGDRAAGEGHIGLAGDVAEHDVVELAAGEGHIRIADGVGIAADVEVRRAAAGEGGVDLGDLVGVAADDQVFGGDPVIVGEGIDDGAFLGGTGHVGVDFGAGKLELGALVFRIDGRDRVAAGQVGFDRAFASDDGRDIGALDRDLAGGGSLVGELQFGDGHAADGDVGVLDSVRSMDSMAS